MEGRSLNENSTPSRAPAASITALNMARAVWRKSRSAVNSGPRSARASTVRNSFLRLVPCNASRGGASEKPERYQRSIRGTSELLVSLVQAKLSAPQRYVTSNHCILETSCVIAGTARKKRPHVFLEVGAYLSFQRCTSRRVSLTGAGSCLILRAITAPTSFCRGNPVIN